MNWKQRSSKMEELDDMGISGDGLTKSLDELSWVHKYLGGHFITVRTLKHALSYTETGQAQPVRILDAGCGGGDSLRSMSKWSKSKNLDVELYGIDGNPATIEYARERSVEFPEIQFTTADLFSNDIDWGKYDIVMFALVLHHFKNEEILKLLKQCANAEVPLVCINDLHRHPMAYYLFAVLSGVIGFSSISRKDGLTSIQKAFTKAEIESLLEQAGYKDHSVGWQWAFRYEAIAQLRP